MLTKVDSDLCVYWCESNKHDYFADIRISLSPRLPFITQNIALMRCKMAVDVITHMFYVFMVRGVVVGRLITSNN